MESELEDLETIAELVAARTYAPGMRGVAKAVADLIAEGKLVPGTRMPSIRRLAEELDISPTTVAAAWSHLASLGSIESYGRKGTYVSARNLPSRPRRRWHYSDDSSSYHFDLSTGVPDPELLPDPRSALNTIDLGKTASYLDPPVLSELTEEIFSLLPGSFGRFDLGLTVVDGALDAIGRVLDLLPKRPGAVAIEEPCFPALYDLIESKGYAVHPVPLDDHGLMPGALESTLSSQRIRALICQPRAQNPTGVSTTAERRDQIAAVLAGHPEVYVIEDDHSALVSESPLASLVEKIPERTAYVLSFSKSHGPDLRLAAIVADTAAIADLESARTLGPSWSSKILQAILLVMLRSATTGPFVAEAARTYGERRLEVSTALGLQGVRGDGINLWVAWTDLSLLIHLAHEKIRVVPGSHFYLAGSSSAPTFRLTLGDPWNPFDVVMAALSESMSRSLAAGPYR